MKTQQEDPKNLFKEYLKSKPTLEEFRQKAKTLGFSKVRVTSLNGESKAVTMDIQVDRINVAVEAPVKGWDTTQVGKQEVKTAVVDMDKAIVLEVSHLG